MPSTFPPYDGPLGVHFDAHNVHGGADFYLWAPTADGVVLKLLGKKLGSATVSMVRGKSGQWHTRVNTDVWGATYWYELTFSSPHSEYIKAVNGGNVPRWARPLPPTSCVVEAVDPHVKAVTVNGERGVAIDPACFFAPRTWPTDATKPAATANSTDATTSVQRITNLSHITKPTNTTHSQASVPQGGREQDGGAVGVEKRKADAGEQTPIIYELHVRDLTIAPENGIEHKGQYLGLTEAGTRTAKGYKSGLDYIADLGVSHVQLMPVFDFGSVDEGGDLSFGAQYNWGYDPVHYNVPEGSYASDPRDPEARVRELRQLIDAFHARGIGVIMDVVYNHVWNAVAHSFERTVPGYYFRMEGGLGERACAEADGASRVSYRAHDAHDHYAHAYSPHDHHNPRPAPRFLDGSFCGNETASERPMVRRFIIDSMLYWARVYGVDGFRLDLMGLHDVVTINELRHALDREFPGRRIVLLGEGWEMGNHPRGTIPATQAHGALMPGIAMFNDTFRDCMKGSVFDARARGFISGAPGCELMLYDALLGAPATRSYVDASQSVVYNEAHDNLTVYDKLVACGAANPERRALFAIQVQLLALGTQFIHAGQEFFRTKHGVENSYRSPDTINAFDYDRAAAFQASVDLVRGLIAFRRRQPWLNRTSYREILASHELLHAGNLRLAYRVRGAFNPIDEPSTESVHSADEGVEYAGREGAGVVNRRDAIVVINGAGQVWRGSNLQQIIDRQSLLVRVLNGHVMESPQPTSVPDVAGLSIAIFEVHS